MLFHSLGLHWKDSYVWTFPFLMKLPNCLLLINSLAINSDVGCLKTFEHLGLFLLSLASKTFIICLGNEIRILASHQERLIQIWFYSLISYPISTPKSSLCPPKKISFQLGCFQPYVQDTSSSWKFPSLYSIYRAMFYVVYFKAWFKCPFLWEAFFIPPIGINFFHPCSTTSFVHSNNRAWMSALLL